MAIIPDIHNRRRKVMKSKRIISILVVLLAASALFANGAKEQGPSALADSKLEALADDCPITSAEAEAVTLPIASDPIVISYFAMPEPLILSKLSGYADMESHKRAEQATGVRIKWREESYTDPKQKMNLMFSTGETEDLIWDVDVHAAGGAQKMLDEGLIIPLNKYIELYAPNLKRILLEDPRVLAQISTDDGRIFMFPEIRYDQVTRSNSGFMIRKDWLDRAGLDVPETIEEWYTALKTFQEMDMNGNGKKDETFIGFGKDKPSQSITNFSTAFGVITEFYIDNGKVKFGDYEDAWKDYLEEMNKWYREGLIDPEFSTLNSTTFNSKMTNDTGSACYGSLSGNFGTFIRARMGSGYDLAAAPFVKAPDGKSYATVNAYAKLVPHGTSISATNKYPIESVKWLDWHYSEEGNTNYNWGVEGETFTVVDGKKQFTSLITANPDGLSIDEAIAKYAGGTLTQMPVINDVEVFRQVKTVLPQQKNASDVWSSCDLSMIMPSLFFPEEEVQRNANILSEVKTYCAEMFNKYIMGIEPLSSFEKYQERLKLMGIEEVLDSYQRAYDRYLEKYGK